MSDAAPSKTAPVAFELVAPIAVGRTTKVELCRLIGPADGGLLVAVKRPRSKVVAEPGYLPRFFEAAARASKLRHPSVTDVRGWGEDEQGPYVALELVMGVSLGRLMKTVFETGEVFTERLVVYVGSLLARGLAAGHPRLAHGNFRAGKVLVGFQGEVKIADFGLPAARRLAAPPATPDDDVVALGALLFELLGAVPPFEATPSPSTDAPEDHVTSRSLRELRPKLDKRLLAVVEHALDRRGTRETAQAIAGDLESWLDAHGYRDNSDNLSRFVRRNSMRQMRWFERATAGNAGSPLSLPPDRPSLPPPEPPTGPARMIVTPASSSAATLAGPRGRAAAVDDPESFDEDRAPTRKVAPVLDLRMPIPPPGPGDTGESRDTRTVPRHPHPEPVPAPVAPSEPPPQSGSEDTYVDQGAADEAAPDPGPQEIEEEVPTVAIRRAMLPKPAPARGRPSDAAPVRAPSAPPPARPAAPPPPPVAARAPARPPPQPRPAAHAPAAHASITEALLEAEAERLRVLAAGKAEEAKLAATQARAANERAQRAAGVARRASEAAAVARDAIKIARKVGLGEAAKRLERARALEASLDADRSKT